MADPKPLALISEDTELGRWALKRALDAEGFDVTAVETWREAAEWLRQEEFALVLLAVSSAPGDAAEIVADVRRHHPRTHLVLLAEEDVIKELRQSCGPALDILPKPLDLATVASVALARRSAAGIPATIRS